MPEIVLSTLNARYAHASFGLRYLYANLGDLQPRSAIAEFDISQRPLDIVEKLLARQPRIIGLGVYIWNAAATAEVVSLLKRLAPRTWIILGGPEVSYETDNQAIVQQADYVVTGEADLEFPRLCSRLLSGNRPLDKVIAASPPALRDLRLPYDYYTPEDIAQRVIYVEASRGCPFTCEFCLSSLEIPVRQAALAPFLAAMESLLNRGVLQFKFVDRTFNLNIQTSQAILQFFLDRMRPGLFVHFEMIPDRLPESLRSLIARFPAGSLQFEVGVQSLNPEVQQLISRRQNDERMAENLRWLRQETSVHVHADLIVGLPGESLASFASGFNRLYGLQPQEIQVGMLKRLRGTPIVRHDAEWHMLYSPHPPYEILSTSVIDFATMCRLRRFSRYWDIVANSGRFLHSLPLLLGQESPFERFLALSDWLWETTRQTHGIALVRLFELLARFARLHQVNEAAPIEAALVKDYKRTGRSDHPSFLSASPAGVPKRDRSAAAPRRQIRHERDDADHHQDRS